jgi:hypothetical protein
MRWRDNIVILGAILVLLLAATIHWAMLFLISVIAAKYDRAHLYLAALHTVWLWMLVGVGTVVLMKYSSLIRYLCYATDSQYFLPLLNRRNRLRKGLHHRSTKLHSAAGNIRVEEEEEGEESEPCCTDESGRSCAQLSPAIMSLLLPLVLFFLNLALVSIWFPHYDRSYVMIPGSKNWYQIWVLGDVLKWLHQHRISFLYKDYMPLQARVWIKAVDLILIAPIGTLVWVLPLEIAVRGLLPRIVFPWISLLFPQREPNHGRPAQRFLGKWLLLSVCGTAVDAAFSLTHYAILPNMFHRLCNHFLLNLLLSYFLMASRYTLWPLLFRWIWECLAPMIYMVFAAGEVHSALSLALMLTQLLLMLLIPYPSALSSRAVLQEFQDSYRAALLLARRYTALAVLALRMLSFMWVNRRFLAPIICLGIIGLSFATFFLCAVILPLRMPEFPGYCDKHHFASTDKVTSTVSSTCPYTTLVTSLGYDENGVQNVTDLRTWTSARHKQKGDFLYSFCWHPWWGWKKNFHPIISATDITGQKLHRFGRAWGRRGDNRQQGDALNTSDPHYKNDLQRRLYPTGFFHPNVVVYVLDSMSAAHFARSMPKSFAALQRMQAEEKMHIAHFPFYHAIGRGTYANQPTLYGGMSYGDITPEIKSGQVVNPNWLWNYARDRGYVTLVQDGMCSGAVQKDMNLSPGRNRTVDHTFIDPWCMPNWRPYTPPSDLKHGKEFCYDGEEAHKIVVNYLSDFLETYADTPTYISSCTNEPHERYGLFAQEIDDDIVDFFENIPQIENTVMIFMSDHGLGYGNLEYLMINEMDTLFEYNYPFFFMGIGKNVAEQYPYLVEAVERNREKTVSPYDVYATLRQTIGLYDYFMEHFPEGRIKQDPSNLQLKEKLLRMYQQQSQQDPHVSQQDGKAFSFYSDVPWLRSFPEHRFEARHHSVHTTWDARLSCLMTGKLSSEILKTPPNPTQRGNLLDETHLEHCRQAYPYPWVLDFLQRPFNNGQPLWTGAVSADNKTALYDR